MHIRARMQLDDIPIRPKSPTIIASEPSVMSAGDECHFRQDCQHLCMRPPLANQALLLGIDDMRLCEVLGSGLLTSDGT